MASFSDVMALIPLDSCAFDAYFLNERSALATSNLIPTHFYPTAADDSSGNNSVNSSYLSQGSASSSSSMSHSAAASTSSSRNSRCVGLTPQTAENKLALDESGLNLTRASRRKIGTIKENVAVTAAVAAAEAVSRAHGGQATKRPISPNARNSARLGRLGHLGHSANVSGLGKGAVGARSDGVSGDQSSRGPASWSRVSQDWVGDRGNPQTTRSARPERAQAVRTRMRPQAQASAKAQVKKAEEDKKQTAKARKKVNDSVNGDVVVSLHKYGLDLDKSLKVNQLTEFENTLYQNQVWKTMIKNPNSFQGLRGKIAPSLKVTSV